MASHSSYIFILVNLRKPAKCATQLALPPSALQVQSVVDIAQWVAFHEHHVSTEALLDTTAIAEAEALGR